ncbi:hypothetical protein P8625_11850 [Tenacibaculum tangerinum]|uniref:SMI1/KNR4 family protein n=1 Tax=Tenacibaculum tangerinum TaxID=3038772 RepID=A0ABY8KZW3_9FLAO|nr:hypothetical protein [Tenacibaculum tangerinum]WGH74771.1 hypothetical protein P8625_11850 [Tenacibaculum tangerinum]
MMNYKFKTQKLDIEKSIYYFIELDNEKYYSLGRLSESNWTPEKAQELLDEIELSREKEKEDEYIWANEDVTLYSNKHGVFLIDEIAIRYGERDSEKIGLELSHDDFILFMKDFKSFIEENTN